MDLHNGEILTPQNCFSYGNWLLKIEGNNITVSLQTKKFFEKPSS